MKYFIYIVIAVVISAIVVGFVIAGSPQNSRARRFDERRVQDLQNIQWQVVNHWQRKATVPTSTNDLYDSLSGSVIPVDPKDNSAYKYEKTGTLSFKLCATFETESTEDRRNDMSYAKPTMTRGDDVVETWAHGVGERCFDRTINPDFYKPFQPEAR